MMETERRRFLAGSSALCAAWGLPLSGVLQAAERRCFVSACSDRKQHTLARVIGEDGRTVTTLPLPGRGHGAARRPDRREIVVFARRPGRFALVFNPLSGEAARCITAAEGRHFYGHGTFSRDGRWLYVSENDYDNARGCIGVYDATAGYRREAELEAFAIGPHELVLLSDGRTLAVANGGIQTHPATGRKKLNIETMQPSLAYIDAQSGSLLHDHRLPAALHQASIRHIALSGDDEVAVVMQYEGPRNDLVPLVGFHRGGEAEIALPNPGDAVLRSLRQYCGAAAVDATGQVLAASSPRGGVITFWSMAQRRYLSSLSLGDGSGIAASGEAGGFLASSGYGDLVHCNALSGETTPLHNAGAAPVAWDNHLLALAL